MDIPTFNGDLCQVSPISVKPSSGYEPFRIALSEFSASASSLKAESETAYASLSSKLAELKHLKKELSGHRESMEKEMLDAQVQLVALFTRLETPINEAIACISNETTLYRGRREQVQREFDETIRQKNALEQQKAKRKEDLMALRKQINGARQIADHSETSGMIETAKEIRMALQRFATFDVNTDAYQQPLKNVQEIRDIIAKAFLNEQQRSKTVT